jgi:nicotinamidase-related amidase
MEKALIVIDIQKDYFPGGRMPLDGIERASRNCRSLLERFRSLHLPTFIVRHLFTSPDAPFFLPDTTGSELHPDAAPTSRDQVIVKNHVNCFRGTDLLHRLEQRSVKELILCGAMSHMCVDAAVRAAADLEFRCTVVHDACATRGQVFNGVTVPAQQVHAAYMAALGFAYADLVSTGDVISGLDRR